MSSRNKALKEAFNDSDQMIGGNGKPSTLSADHYSSAGKVENSIQNDMKKIDEQKMNHMTGSNSIPNESYQVRNADSELANTMPEVLAPSIANAGNTARPPNVDQYEKVDSLPPFLLENP